MLKISQEKAYEAQEKAYGLQEKKIDMQEKLDKLFKVNETLIKTIEILKNDQNSSKGIHSEIKDHKIESIAKKSSISSIKDITSTENNKIFKYEKNVYCYFILKKYKTYCT